MLAVLLVSRASAFGDWLGMVLVLGALVVLAGIGSPRSRVLVIGLLVAGLVAAGVATAEAVLIPCPWYWKGWLC